MWLLNKKKKPRTVFIIPTIQFVINVLELIITYYRLDKKKKLNNIIRSTAKETFNGSLCLRGYMVPIEYICESCKTIVLYLKTIKSCMIQ